MQEISDKSLANSRPKINIGILTFPAGKTGCIPLSNLIDILHPLSSSLYVITGNDGYDLFKNDPRIKICGIPHKSGTNIISRVVNYIIAQIKISTKFLKKDSQKVDCWFFFLGGPALAIPMLTAKFFGKKVILIFAGSDVESVKADSINLSKPIAVLVSISLLLSDKIILYSSNLVRQWNLEKYEHKICVAPRHFVDFNNYNIKTKYSDRSNTVGYIGRLSVEKGVFNYVEAIPIVLSKRPDVIFQIIGQGPLIDKIKEYLIDKRITENVKLIGWVNHKDLPKYLNQLKLVVLPSYTEGLPNIILEAMACGTPVLATPVGAIPDIIKKGENGFIMDNNSPECIAENILSSINDKKLEQITTAALEFVKTEFTYERTIFNYSKIINGL